MIDNDYIRRKEAIGIALDWCPDDDGSVVETGDLRGMLDELEAIPAADVRPVVKAVWEHVRWVVDEEWQEGGYWISRCSNCSMPYHTETPFCPHCGADMREAHDGI